MKKRLAKKILKNKKELNYSPHQIAKAEKRLKSETNTSE
jgi:DNA-binding LacI/PurR family transcriptional regulator